MDGPWMDHGATFCNLSRGVRQGCGLSPYRSILYMEIVAEAIRKNSEISGIKTQDTEYKSSQYTDDTTLILDGSGQSFKISLFLIDAFGKISGLRLNDRKKDALWTRSKTNCRKKVCLEKKIQMAKEKVKALGVWFPMDQPEYTAIPLNYDEKPLKIRDILGCWRFRIYGTINYNAGL